MKKYLLILPVLLAFSVKSQVCFLPEVNYSGGTNVRNIVTADFNGDGFKDLVTCNSGSNDVTILLGTGTGTFGTPTAFSQSFGTDNLCAGDFNNDGKMDIASVNPGMSSLVVSLGDGAGNLGAPTAVGNGTSSLCSGDFNNDGNLDLAVGNYSSANITVYYGNGTGAFPTSSNSPAGAGPTGITCKDFNTDGNLDIAVANYTSNNISVLIGNGSGTFVRTNYAAGTAPSFITSADFNGDNFPDIVSSNQNSGNVSVLIGTGTGSFSPSVAYTSSPNPNSLTCADFNSDGFQDIAVAGNFTNNVAVLLNSGTGTFGSPVDFTASFSPRGICSGDFNGDGKPDIATGNSGSSDISVLLNTATPVVSINPSSVTVCSGTSVTLNGQGATTYSWTGGISNGVAFVPMSTNSYTVTGTINGCSANASITVNVNSSPTVAAGNYFPAVCAGQQAFLYGVGNAISYSWTGGVTDSVAFTPVSSSSYTVTGTAANGCTATATTSVTINNLPNVTAQSSAGTSFCAGTSVSLFGTGANNYYWNGGVQNNIPFVPSGSQTYTVTGQDANGCLGTAVISLTVHSLPNVTANASAQQVCQNSPLILSGGGAVGYSWSGEVQNNIPFNATSSQTYTVTGMDVNGCSNSATISIFVSTPSTPEICMVTVDDYSINNIIIWDKTIYNNADTFYVYRDTANNAFGLIGKVPFDSLSQFIDTVRTRYAANGDPQASSWRYKIAIKDTCGNLSAKSPYHQSIFMQNNSGNFIWSEYKIEGQTLPVPSLNNYLFKRDDFNTGVYNTIQTLSASSTSYTDPQYVTYQGTANWRIETQWTISCDPQRALVNTSRSNIKNQIAPTTGIKSADVTQLSVFPNPVKDVLNFQCGSEKIQMIEIQNAIGEIVMEKTCNGAEGMQSVSLSSLEPGVYFVLVTTANKARLNKRIVKAF